MPSKALEYFISTPHWLDAFTPPLEERLTQLAAAVKALLGTIQPGRLGRGQAERPPPSGLVGVAAKLMDANRMVPVLASPSANAALRSWARASLQWRVSLKRRA